jgi:hypothetical protein
MSEELNAVEEVVEPEVIVEDATPAEEEIAAVVPEKKAASRGKKIQAEPEDAAEEPAQPEEVVEVVVPAPVVAPTAVAQATTRGGMSLSIRNRK